MGPPGCVSTKSLVRRINDEKWISEQWGNIFINPPTTGSTGKILVADVHRSQQTDGAKALLKKKNTELVNVPPGCTSRVQPLDVSFNKPFKDVVRQQFEKHLEENLQQYTEGKITLKASRDTNCQQLMK